MTAVIVPVAGVLDDLDALVPPAFWHCPEYVETIGPEVGDLNRLFGRVPNPEQQLLHDAAFGMDQTGRLAAFEVFVLAARQNFKTGWLEQRALGKALLLKRPLQIWTAHKESATDQAFANLKQLAEESEEFGRRVKAMPEGKGSKAVQFVNGCTIVFRPRTGKAGQSMSADDVDLDEYFAVEPKHEGSLIPTLSTRPNAQVGMVSSAPHLGSTMQRQVMARGRAAAEGLVSEPRLLYAEWSAMVRAGETLDGKPKYSPRPCALQDCDHGVDVEGCIADDREVIKLTNPSVGRSAAPSISWAFVEAERRKLQGEALEEYLKERLSIGVEDADGATVTIFGPATTWQAGGREFVADGVGAIGVAMMADRSTIALTGASVVEVVDGDDPEAEPVDRVLVAPIMHTQDIEAAIAEMHRLQDKHDCVVALDEKGPAAALLDRLEEADVAVELMTLAEYAKGSASFFDRVTAVDPQTRAPAPTLLHLVNADLDQHVARATWRWVGDNRIISRREGADAVDTTLLEGAVIAAYQAELLGTVFNIF